MKVKEVFYSIQGEGANSGRPAVFCRFSGCNLWSGREEDRQKSVCKFCDTDFLGGRDYDEDELVSAIIASWGTPADLSDFAAGTISVSEPLVVFTGGEPGLQLTESLLNKLRRSNFNVAVETNGTVPIPKGVYWITVSPKFGSEIRQTSGHELKVVWPQSFDLAELRRLDFMEFYLQPMDGYPNAVDLAVKTVLANPGWRLSLQTHKIVGIR